MHIYCFRSTCWVLVYGITKLCSKFGEDQSVYRSKSLSTDAGHQISDTGHASDILSKATQCIGQTITHISRVMPMNSMGSLIMVHTVETKIPDVYIQVLDHTPSSHFQHNDLYSHMQRSSTTSTRITKSLHITQHLHIPPTTEWTNYQPELTQWLHFICQLVSDTFCITVNNNVTVRHQLSSSSSVTWSMHF